jgi:bifunctional enzyme CysN/CysC
MPWYEQGPLLAYLENVHVGSDRNMIDFRLPVQYVIRPDLSFRGFAGTIAGGILRPGDEIQVAPRGTRSRVKEISTFDGPLEEAFPPLTVAVTLEDEIDISRGDMLAHPGNQPRVDRDFEAMLVWMGEEPMLPGQPYFIKHASNLVGGSIKNVRYRVDINTLRSEEAKELQLNEVGRVHVGLNRAIPFDAYRKNRATGSFIVVDRVTNNTLGAGMIVDRRPADHEGGGFWETEVLSEHLEQRFSPVEFEERAARYAQRPATLLLTGLTGSGKTTLAYQLERRLFDDGRQVAVLDGENLRLGISRDLGFTGTERSENMRRAAELARVVNDMGAICICAMTAPDAGVRALARDRIGGERFLEIHLDAPLETCRERVPDMYARADSGEIEAFPGVTGPYDIPTQPDLSLRTDQLDVQTCVDEIVRLLEERGIIRA